MSDEKRVQRRFVLERFVPDHEFRLFHFVAVESRLSEKGFARTAFTVRTDLSLIRRYGIHLQDLPLLCVELLERRAVSEAARHLTLTEEDMRIHQAGRVAEASMRKKYRRPPPENAGHGWRTTNPLIMEKHTS